MGDELAARVRENPAQMASASCQEEAEAGGEEGARGGARARSQPGRRHLRPLTREGR